MMIKVAPKDTRCFKCSEYRRKYNINKRKENRIKRDELKLKKKEYNRLYYLNKKSKNK